VRRREAFGYGPRIVATGITIESRVVSANGLEFGILEAGAGPLALCVHGFPDTAHTWRHLLPELAAAGFHAVAPFTRGYAPTSVPADGDYGTGALVADVNALHEALGGDERAVLIGHDWGAKASYGAAAAAPGRWRRVVALSVPPDSLNQRMFSDYEQLRRFFYVFFFLTPLAEPVTAADDLAFIDRLWRDWSPGYDASEELARVKESLGRPENLAAAIGYYRAIMQSEPLPSGLQPFLYLHGERDGCVGLDIVRDIEEHLAPGSRLEVVEGTGHTPHLERPAEVNGLILGWVT
jgi:pimeloyl-ACP methyl ester carboxylesterase